MWSISPLHHVPPSHLLSVFPPFLPFPEISIASQLSFLSPSSLTSVLCISGNKLFTVLERKGKSDRRHELHEQRAKGRESPGPRVLFMVVYYLPKSPRLQVRWTKDQEGNSFVSTMPLLRCFVSFFSLFSISLSSSAHDHHIKTGHGCEAGWLRGSEDLDGRGADGMRGCGERPWNERRIRETHGSHWT